MDIVEKSYKFIFWELKGLREGGVKQYLAQDRVHLRGGELKQGFFNQLFFSHTPYFPRSQELHF